MQSSHSWHQGTLAGNASGSCSGSLAQEHWVAPIWGQDTVDWSSLGPYSFGASFTSRNIALQVCLAALQWLGNWGLNADGDQVAALRQICCQFALTQDTETKPILHYKGELFFNNFNFYFNNIAPRVVCRRGCSISQKLKHLALVIFYSFHWPGFRS